MAKILLTLRDEDCGAADRIAKELQDIGWPYASRLLVIREGVGCITDALRGKSQEEILAFFVERRARRAQRKKIPPSS